MVPNVSNPDTIYYNGKIVTVDANFSIAQALAVSKDRFLTVGSDTDVLSLASDNTVLIDLEGSTIIPGLNDSHLHPTMAAVSEVSGEIPDIHTREELLAWIETEVSLKKPGEWIIHPKFFITRTRERKYPLLADLDSLAPDHPLFLDGTYSGMVNTRALRDSGLLTEKLHPGILTDPETGNPLGIIRPELFPILGCNRNKKAGNALTTENLETMLNRYNHVGITSITDGMVKDSDYGQYLTLKKEGRLNVRVNMCHIPDFKTSGQSAESVVAEMKNRTGYGDEFVRTGPLKIFLDGGILTGTAAINKPWGKKCQGIFGFDGSDYYGHLNYTQEQLTEIAMAAVKYNWKFTAHCIGDKALEMLLTAYEKADKIKKIKKLRWSVIHGNFFDSAAIKRAAKLGVIIEFQIAWLYKDASYIEYILGKEYRDKFLPLRSMLDSNVKLAGGSDHMVKFDSIRSINPYNPFLSIQTMITREVEDGRIINRKETITREEALRLYTIAGAYSTGEESIKGSIEPGKLADMLILDTDYLFCNENTIKNIKVKTTVLGGKVVFQA